MTEIITSAEQLENDVLPTMREVHSNGEDGADSKPLPAALKQSAAGKTAAQWAYERLIMYIKNFEETLDNDHEVGMGFVGGDAGVIRVEGLGFYEPDIITFYGSDMAGAKTQIIQHVSQMNLMLRAAPKHIDQAQPNRIGFRLATELDDPATT